MSHANISIFIPHAGCPHTCIFCNQHKISGAAAVPDPEAVRAELAAAAKSLKTPENTEIAYFGGSFTCLPLETMTELLAIAQGFVKEYGLAGIRISTRPDAVTEEIIEILNRFGVTAVELGAQSMDDSVLTLCERGHTSADVTKAVKLLKRSFTGETGLQMMTGLYGSTPESDRKTANQMAALACLAGVDTVRIYPTVIISGTKLDKLYQSGVYKPIAFDETVSLVADITTIFEKAGVRIIRTGLHASAELETQITGGFYHPALGELVESELFYRKVLSKIPAQIQTQMKNKGDYKVFVHPKNISKMIGQKRKNILRFAENGYNITVHPNENLSAEGRETVVTNLFIDTEKELRT
jgi:histone acetyltransferase (RNA polymerase elongator complex component)